MRIVYLYKYKVAVWWFVFATFYRAVKQMAVYFIHKSIAEE